PKLCSLQCSPTPPDGFVNDEQPQDDFNQLFEPPPPPTHPLPDPPLAHLDWPKWHSTMVWMIDYLGLHSHICHLPIEGQIIDPMSIAVVPSPYDKYSILDDTLAFWQFWEADDAVSHILTVKLHNNVLNSIPDKRGPPHGLPTTTAQDIYTILTRHFSVTSATTAKALCNKLYDLKTLPNGIPAYVAIWCVSVPQLAQTEWDMSPYNRVQGFLDGLPPLASFVPICEEVCKSWQQKGKDGSFIFSDIADTVLQIDMDCQRIANIHQPPSSHKSDQPHVDPSTSTTVSAPNTMPATATKPCIQCSNCNQYGHTINKCWSKGGGIENGQELDQNCLRAHLAETECIASPLSFVPEADKNITEFADEANELMISAYDCNITENVLPVLLYSNFINSASPQVLASMQYWILDAPPISSIIASGSGLTILS
ncbi:hypothetical protein H0H87_000828, partial [Tephrocybe sp. NHM501043]